MNTSTLDQARDVKDLARRCFSDLPGVQVLGVGLTRQDGGYAVKVNLASSPNAQNQKGRTLQGVPVVVEIVGSVLSG